MQHKLPEHEAGEQCTLSSGGKHINPKVQNRLARDLTLLELVPVPEDQQPTTPPISTTACYARHVEPA